MQALQVDFRHDFTKEKYKDTGYRLREKFLDNGYKGKIIVSKSTRDYKLGSFHKIICGEFYLKGYERIFGSHFGRGSSMGWAKYKKLKGTKIYNLPKIGKFLLKLKGKNQKRRWIKLCEKIVDEQIN